MNTFGHQFRLTTFGESHGVAIGGVIDGCPAGLTLDKSMIDAELARRRGGGQDATARCEADVVEWLSGVVDDVALGTPIAFMVKNADARPDDYQSLRNLYRPGHADYTYEKRYGLRDHRGGGRASARETVARVVAGAVAKRMLSLQGVSVSSQALPAPHVPENDDTYGGIVSCLIDGLAAGIGSPIFGRLNSMLAAAAFSIPSVIGFEMGDGFAAAGLSGRQFIDQWDADTFPNSPCATNRCGGIQGGISNGMPISFRVAFHPIATQPSGMDCIDAHGRIVQVAPGGRHDRCQVLRAAVIVESMAAIALVDAMMCQSYQFKIC